MTLLPARDYPWPEPLRTGVLTPRGLREGDPPAELAGRVPVAAVGSNASARVLRHKLGDLLGTGLPIAGAVVEGLAVGHSAHISARGYVAAAPFRGTGGAPRTVTVAWLDGAQLAAMDATEPNYTRVPLPAGMPCSRGGEPLTGVEVYRSAHGVLGDGGQALDLQGQGAVLGWLADRLPGLAEELDHERLATPGIPERVRVAIADAGLVVDAGL